jgi:hypothetical protein
MAARNKDGSSALAGRCDRPAMAEKGVILPFAEMRKFLVPACKGMVLAQ